MLIFLKTIILSFTFILHTVERLLTLFQHILVWFLLYEKVIRNVNEDYKSLICIIIGKAERCLPWGAGTAMLSWCWLPLWEKCLFSCCSSSLYQGLPPLLCSETQHSDPESHLGKINNYTALTDVRWYSLYLHWLRSFSFLCNAFKHFKHHLKGVITFQKPSNKCKSIFSLMFIFH